MSGSFESVRVNACVHRLDLGLYSYPKELSGNGFRTHVNSKGKIPSIGKNSPQRRIESTTPHQAGQRAQHTTNELFRPPLKSVSERQKVQLWQQIRTLNTLSP